MIYRNVMSKKMSCRWGFLFVGFALLSWIVRPLSAEESKYIERRNHLVKRTIEDRGVRESETLRAMYTVPRHEFVPEELRENAYQDAHFLSGWDRRSHNRILSRI